jgi:hypothetical protein
LEAFTDEADRLKDAQALAKAAQSGIEPLSDLSYAGPVSLCTRGWTRDRPACGYSAAAATGKALMAAMRATPSQRTTRSTPSIVSMTAVQLSTQ